jgi:putative tryptophan/tyrosine transport system substrate-binding protein
MRRREFIGLVGSAVAGWPSVVRAQLTAMPVIGFLNGASAQAYSRMLAAFFEGLREMEYIEHKNVRIEYQWAEGQVDRLPAMAADLVRRGVTVIAATGTPAALAAKAATATIPIVFETGSDPVHIGLVSSLNRPGGNLTGIAQLAIEVAPKRIELLHEMVPAAKSLALLVDPTDRMVSEDTMRGARAAATTLGLDLHVLSVNSASDFGAIFTELVRLGAGGLLISGGQFFNSRSQQLAAMALQHTMPTIFPYRDMAAAGGLMSYGTSTTEAYRLAGAYTGRVLKGEKPSDLPVQQATKVELVVNLKTAKALGLAVPMPLLGRADEIIE